MRVNCEQLNKPHNFVLGEDGIRRCSDCYTQQTSTLPSTSESWRADLCKQLGKTCRFINRGGEMRCVGCNKLQEQVEEEEVEKEEVNETKSKNKKISSILTPREALNQLIGDPETFLRKNFLSISPTLYGQTKPYHIFIPEGINIHYRKDKKQGMRKLHEVGVFKILQQAPIGVESTIFFANVFQMHDGKDGTIPNLIIAETDCVKLYRKTYSVPIMFTGPLSGCSVIIEDNPEEDHIKCYHYKPSAVGGKSIKGSVMENNLRSRPRFRENCVIYGANPDNGGYDSARNKVNIIGIYQTTGWKIYAQIYLIVDEDDNRLSKPIINEVKRIYPP